MRRSFKPHGLSFYFLSVSPSCRRGQLFRPSCHRHAFESQSKKRNSAAHTCSAVNRRIKVSWASSTPTRLLSGVVTSGSTRVYRTAPNNAENHTQAGAEQHVGGLVVLLARFFHDETSGEARAVDRANVKTAGLRLNSSRLIPFLSTQRDSRIRRRFFRSDVDKASPCG